MQKRQDFYSLTKRRAAELRRERPKTGGEPLNAQPLTPEEEKALAILGPTVALGITGGIDVCGEEFPSSPLSLCLHSLHPLHRPN